MFRIQVRCIRVSGHLMKGMDRRREASMGQFDSLAELEDFGEQAFSSLLYLQLELFGAHDDQQVDYMASHVGVAGGIVSLLRQLPSQAVQRHSLLPREILDKHRPSTSATLGRSTDPEDTRRFRDAVFDVAAQAYGHLDRARELSSQLPAEKTRVLRLEAAALSLFLEGLRLKHFDVYDSDLYTRHRIRAPFHLLRARISGHFS